MIKRMFDIFAVSIGIVLLSPFLLIIGLWIKFDSEGPVIFSQIRVGRYGVPFRIHKFRTMRVGSEGHGQLTIGHDARVTRSGKYLRKSKLDELPQLFDVFVGKMSIVGPRPEVQKYVDYYPTEVKHEILSVRPGISDRASIEMVNENFILGQYTDPENAYIDIILPIKQKYYLEYVRNHSFIGDIVIILGTIRKLCSSSPKKHV